jgi:hypothetical protein
MVSGRQAMPNYDTTSIFAIWLCPLHVDCVEKLANDRSRKSRFLAPNLICAGHPHDEAHGRATRGKIARAADPLPNFPSRSSMETLRAFRQAYENDALTGSGRTPGGQRKDVTKYEMLDLQLCDRGDGPYFYDTRTSQLAIMNGEAEPVYYNMRFRVADVLKVISADGGEALEAPSATGGETASPEPVSPKPASEPLMRKRAAEKLLQLYPEESLPKYSVMLDDLKKVGIRLSPRTLTRVKRLALELRAKASHATPG